MGFPCICSVRAFSRSAGLNFGQKQIEQVMWTIIKVLFISITLLKSVFSECMVKEKKSRREKPCQFPFTITDDGTDTTYNTCTDVFDDDGRYWCSTKVRFTIMKPLLIVLICI